MEHVLGLPHNIPAYRCHRFAASNEINERLADVGMKFASNICTDLEVVPPFRDRCGVLQFPVFLEDGAYLRRGHPLAPGGDLEAQVATQGLHVLLIHPMHFRAQLAQLHVHANFQGLSVPRRVAVALHGRPSWPNATEDPGSETFLPDFSSTRRGKGFGSRRSAPSTATGKTLRSARSAHLDSSMTISPPSTERKIERVDLQTKIEVSARVLRES